MRTIKHTKSQAEIKKFTENSEVKKTVYHGTDASFSEFESFRVGGKDFPEAIYFSSNKKVARTYGEKILKAKIRLDNPYYFDAGGRTFNDAYDALRSAFDTAINSNRDGVVIINIYDDWTQSGRNGKGTTYAVFSNEQVLIQP